MGSENVTGKIDYSEYTFYDTKVNAQINCLKLVDQQTVTNEQVEVNEEKTGGVRKFELVLSNEDKQTLDNQKNLSTTVKVVIRLPRYYHKQTSSVGIRTKYDELGVKSYEYYARRLNTELLHALQEKLNNSKLELHTDYYQEEMLGLELKLRIDGSTKKVDVDWQVVDGPAKIVTPPIYDDGFNGIGGYVIQFDSELKTYVLTRYLKSDLTDAILSSDTLDKYIFGFDALYSQLYTLKAFEVDRSQDINLIALQGIADFLNNKPVLSTKLILFRKNLKKDNLANKSLSFTSTDNNWTLRTET
jgi:hypothetical protein